MRTLVCELEGRIESERSGEEREVEITNERRMYTERGEREREKIRRKGEEGSWKKVSQGAHILRQAWLSRGRNQGAFKSA